MRDAGQYHRWARYGGWTVAAAASVYFVIQLSRMLAGLRFEDALIILRYGRNLAAGEGFVFNPGEHVLGATSPLQALLTAGVMLVTASHAPVVLNVIGIAFLALLAWVMAWLVRRHNAPWVGLLAALLVVGNLNLTYLYVGMEVPLFAFLILLAFAVFLSGGDTLLGVVLGIAFLVRYDAALPALLMGSCRWIQRKSIPWRLVLVSLAIAAPWLIFAQLYFGSVLPSALGAKQGHTGVWNYLGNVWAYYGGTFTTLASSCRAPAVIRRAAPAGSLFLIVFGMWRLIRADRRYGLLFLYAFLHVVVYAAIGADPGFRWHYFILNPVLFMAFAAGFCGMARLPLRLLPGRTGTPQCIRAGIFAALCCLLLVPLTLHLYRALQWRYRPDPHTGNLYTIAQWIDTRYGDDTSLMNPSIGILGYETNLRMVDHAGLVTEGLRYLDGTRHTALGEVLERHTPDLVLLPAAVAFDAGRHGYRLLKAFELEHPYALYERTTVPTAGGTR